LAAHPPGDSHVTAIDGSVGVAVIVCTRLALKLVCLRDWVRPEEALSSLVLPTETNHEQLKLCLHLPVNCLLL
jgi:hypothetical protein